MSKYKVFLPTGTIQTIIAKSWEWKLKRNPKYFGSASLDYWPPSDYFRFRLKRYGNREWQICLGPIRVDFFRN